MIILSLGAALIAFFSTLMGGLLALRYRRSNILLSAFTGGVLIAVATVDILPETVDMAALISFPLVIPFLFTGLGFAFLLFLEMSHNPQTQSSSGEGRKINGSIAGSEMVAHSFLEGIAIGVAFEINIGVGLTVSLAIIIHDISDGMSIVTIMNTSDYSARASFLMLFLESAATGLGVVFSYFFLVPTNIVVVLLAFIAGGLFYIGAMEMLPRAVRKSNGIVVPTLIGATGFVFICLIIAAT